MTSVGHLAESKDHINTPITILQVLSNKTNLIVTSVNLLTILTLTITIQVVQEDFNKDHKVWNKGITAQIITKRNRNNQEGKIILRQNMQVLNQHKQHLTMLLKLVDTIINSIPIQKPQKYYSLV